MWEKAGWLACTQELEIFSGNIDLFNDPSAILSSLVAKGRGSSEAVEAEVLVRAAKSVQGKERFFRVVQQVFRQKGACEEIFNENSRERECNFFV